jgi:NAD(P)-dependent dehydrogenase (short-subunit alcohol dehydrogenase family)
MNVLGSRVLVTGAGSGIGKATARRFARAEANVIAVDIDGDTAQATADECMRLGRPAYAYTCDVANRDAVEHLAARVEADHGAVDVLVNNAGVGVGGPFLDNSLDDWEWLRGINLDGVVYGCHVFGEGMVARGHGHVVNVASGAGYMPHRYMAAYCASKAAVISLSQCLRADWAGSGVGVSAICPGLIRTPIASRSRLVGKLADKQETAARAFRFGHSPDVVAKAILGAVEKNRAIVPVGIESEFAYRVLRFAPGPVQGLLARAEVP